MEPHQAVIADRLAQVRGRIAAACARAGRTPSDVTLIAVSKTKPASAIREAYEAGQRHFGENYVQELVKKTEVLADQPALVWHFIGRLQRNKARDVVRVGALVDAVDRLDLAIALDMRAGEAGRTIDLLVEVNVAGEASKAGLAPSELGGVLDGIEKLPHVRLNGLMTLPPAGDSPSDARPYFEQLRTLRDAHGGPARLPHLSMGMSGDFEVAIEEGATLVRVGTAIFGAREALAP